MPSPIMMMGGFSPMSIPGMDFFVEMPMGLNLVAGYASAWADQSTSHWDLSEETNRPLYVANQANGWPVLRFDGVNDQLSNATAYRAGAYTVVFVYKSTIPSSAWGTALIVPAGADKTALHALSLTNGVSGYTEIVFSANHSGAVSMFGASPANVHGAYNIIIQSWNGNDRAQASNYSLRFNGNAQEIGQTGIGGFLQEPLCVGRRVVQTAFPFKGDMFAVGRYSQVISTTNAQRLEAYYSAKIGAGAS